MNESEKRSTPLFISLIVLVDEVLPLVASVVAFSAKETLEERQDRKRSAYGLLYPPPLLGGGVHDAFD